MTPPGPSCGRVKLKPGISSDLYVTSVGPIRIHVSRDYDIRTSTILRNTYTRVHTCALHLEQTKQHEYPKMRQTQRVRRFCRIFASFKFCYWLVCMCTRKLFGQAKLALAK